MRGTQWQALACTQAKSARYGAAGPRPGGSARFNGFLGQSRYNSPLLPYSQWSISEWQIN